MAHYQEVMCKTSVGKVSVKCR